ncbi:MAG TPA: alpha/beta fold hydrolase [Steroidobacteraceae bacterium]|jgi:homoserine O-acetyltransferase|nr:alpha/beta fold hydrolase [Steroidobacteraceae bacterium]
MTPPWRDKVFEVDRFSLEAGGEISPLHLSYSICGDPASHPKHIVLLLPSASGLKRWGSAHVGVDATFDPSKSAVVSVDAIGGGLSSRPSERHALEFPQYCVRDNARAIHLLLTRGLGLSSIWVAAGPSMGAMIALELGLLFPHFVANLLLYSPSARCSGIFRVLANAIAKIAILPNGGLHAAGLAYFPLLVTHDYLERLSAAQVAEVAQIVAKSWVSEWQPVDLISRYACVASHDVAPLARDLEATLRGLTSATLLMPSTSDIVLPPSAVQLMNDNIPNSTVVPIQSELGHWAASQPPGSPEFVQIRDATRQFLLSRPI